MHNRCWRALVVALGAAFVLSPAADAQRGGGAGPVRFPTRAQFEASAEAQKRVAAARKIAGTDLVKEFENTCSATGPQRAALAREAAGQSPMKDYTVEPTRVFDNMWYVGLASQGAFVITTSDGIILIDTLYDHHIHLVMSAAATPDRLYEAKKGTEAFEFDRTASRLFEMQSAEYLSTPRVRMAS